MQNFDDFFIECERAPRLNHLAEFFAETAAGRGGMPTRKPVADMRLLPSDDLMHRLVELHARRQGHFDQHYHSSIPYRLEEECRMAYALLRYAQQSVEGLSLYSLGTAEGTMARTLSEMGQGQIQSLSCSPNEENYKCFKAFGDPPHAEFFLGPFHHLTKNYIRGEKTLERFSAGFDVILEDTTFQMYSPNRHQQIGFVAQHLNEAGILLLVEKFQAADPSDYEAREAQKDFGFKTRYFDRGDIERKAKRVLTTMHDSEVTLADMAAAVYAHFRYCVITWNSGNFYGLAASNNENNLRRYLSVLVQPAIPREYTYGPEPFTRLPR
jgi:hypothetical protein